MSSITGPTIVHPTARIEDGAILGAGCRVWSGVHIRAGARLGEGCRVGGNAFVDSGVEIGGRCKILNNALIFHGTRVGDEVFVGPAVVITNDHRPRAATPGGEQLGDGDWTVSGVTIERGAALGAGSVLVAGVHVGAWAMVGAGSVVTRDVPAQRLVAGNPARPLGWVCRCGERLDEALGCAGCGRWYVEGPAGLEACAGAPADAPPGLT